MQLHDQMQCKEKSRKRALHLVCCCQRVSLAWHTWPSHVQDAASVAGRPAYMLSFSPGCLDGEPIAVAVCFCLADVKCPSPPSPPQAAQTQLMEAVVLQVQAGDSCQWCGIPATCCTPRHSAPPAAGNPVHPYHGQGGHEEHPSLSQSLAGQLCTACLA